MLRAALSLGLVMLALCAARFAAADEMLTPLAEIRQHVGKAVSVELVVASSRALESGKYCFLNSHKNFTHKENFTVTIDAEAIAKFAKANIDDPAERFLGKTIRVRGKVSLYRDKPQIIVSDPAQITEVTADKPPTKK
jgi:DNA/RNA endonuclease YhcR with UshA esterase domain